VGTVPVPPLLLPLPLLLPEPLLLPLPELLPPLLPLLLPLPPLLLPPLLPPLLDPPLLLDAPLPLDEPLPEPLPPLLLLLPCPPLLLPELLEPPPSGLSGVRLPSLESPPAQPQPPTSPAHTQNDTRARERITDLRDAPLRGLDQPRTAGRGTNISLISCLDGPHPDRPDQGSRSH
jgi:hypothetical protein